jgi:hypothetical protein
MAAKPTPAAGFLLRENGPYPIPVAPRPRCGISTISIVKTTGKKNVAELFEELAPTVRTVFSMSRNPANHFGDCPISILLFERGGFAMPIKRSVDYASIDLDLGGIDHSDAEDSSFAHPR